jgi:hypothetical protein
MGAGLLARRRRDVGDELDHEHDSGGLTMEITLHIEKVDPDVRWNRVREIDGAFCRFISFRDDATLAWFGAPNGSGIRLA